MYRNALQIPYYFASTNKQNMRELYVVWVFLNQLIYALHTQMNRYSPKIHEYIEFEMKEWDTIYSYHDFAIHLNMEKYLFLRDTSNFFWRFYRRKCWIFPQYASHFSSYVCALQLSNRTSTSLMLLLLQNVDTEQHVSMYWTPPRLVRERFIGSVL